MTNILEDTDKTCLTVVGIPSEQLWMILHEEITMTINSWENIGENKSGEGIKEHGSKQEKN